MFEQKITELLFLLSSNDLKVRTKAIRDLGATYSIEAYNALKNLLKKNDAALRPVIKEALLSIEAKIKEKNEKLIDEVSPLDQPDARPSHLNYDVFLKYLNDEEPKNRIAVVSACSRISRDKNIEKMLIDRLDIENNPFVIATILINLGRCGSERSLDIICSFLNNADERIRANAVEGLEYLQAPLAVEHLLKMASDESARVKANVARALINVDPDFVEKVIQAMLASKDESQVEAARYVIDLAKYKFKHQNANDDLNSEKNVNATNIDLAGQAAGVNLKNNFRKTFYYAAAFAVIFIAVFIYQSFVKERNGAGPDGKASQTEGSNNSYEVELNRKIASLIEDTEKYLSENKPSEAFLSFIRLKQVKPAHEMLRYLEAEIKIAENKHRDALAILKQLPLNNEPRHCYDIGLCYYNIENFPDASKFLELAIKYDGRGKYAQLAEKITSEIKNRRDKQVAEAKKDSDLFMRTFFSMLNSDGPKSLRQYFWKKEVYENFEETWRRSLLDVKQWRIEYKLINSELLTPLGSERTVGVKVLECWQYVNYGMISWITYRYNEYYLKDAPKDYAFETSSVALPVLVNEILDVSRDEKSLMPYEEAERASILLSSAVLNLSKDRTGAVDLIKKLAEKHFKNPAVMLEYLSNVQSINPQQLKAIYEKMQKTKPSEMPSQFYFGNQYIAASILNLIANRYLDLGDEDQHYKIMEKIDREVEGFAEASYELAISLAKKKKDDESIQAVKRALKMEPDFPALEFFFFSDEYNYNVSIMARAELKIDQQVIDDFEKVLRQYPRYWRSYYNVGKLMLVIDASDEARGYFEKALELSPDNCNVLTKLAYCYFRLNDKKKALEINSKAEKLAPDNFQVKRNRTLFTK